MSRISDEQVVVSEVFGPSVRIPNQTPLAARQQFKFHACLNVSDLERSLEFYTALLGGPPVKAYEDYAKFEIDVPPLILSLKPKRACAGGPLNHLGLRVTSNEQLEAIHTRMKKAGARIGRQDDVACCYALQTKLWITDPDQTLWEVYVFHEDAPDWGEKQNLVKLWKAPLRAFGVRGVIRRLWNNATGQLPERAPSGSVPTRGDDVPGSSCAVPALDASRQRQSE